MASTKSLEEMLSSDVDESAVSALVGSLESQLASPTTVHASSQDVSSNENRTVTNNHVNNTTLAGVPAASHRGPPSTTNTNDGQKHGALNAVAQHSTSNSVIINADSSKNAIVSAPNASVAPSTTIQTNTYSVTLPGAVGLPASGYINQFQAIRVPGPTTPAILQRGNPAGTIPNGNAGVAVGGGAIAAALTASKATPPGVITTMAGAVGSVNKLQGATVATTVSVTGIGAMQNLANVAARQQPLIIPTSQQQVRKGHPTQTVIAVTNKQPGIQQQQTSAGGQGNMVMSNQQILQGVQMVNVNQVRAAGVGGPLGPQSQKQLAPRVVLSNPVRIAAGPQVIGARPGTPGAHGVQNTITLQPGMVRGTLLVKTENGQYQLVNVGTALGPGGASGVQGPFRLSSYPAGTQPRPMNVTLPQNQQHLKLQQVKQEHYYRSQAPQVMHTVLQSSPGIVGSMPHTTTSHSAVSSPSVMHHVRGNPVATVQSAAQHMQQQQQQQQQQQHQAVSSAGGMMTNAASVPTSAAGAPSTQSSTAPQMSPDTAKKKCKNFLSTLLRLASDQPDQVATNVKNLIQGLIDGAVAPEDFTNQLQRELNSSPQPCLIPFLKKSLPHLRISLTTKELSIEGVRPPAAVEMPTLTVPSGQPVTTAATSQVQLTQRANLGQQHGHGPLQPPMVRFMSHAPGSVNTQSNLSDSMAVASGHRLVGISRPPRQVRLYQPGQRFAPPLISAVAAPTSVAQGTIRPITGTPTTMAFPQTITRAPAVSRAAGLKAAAAAAAAASTLATSAITTTTKSTAPSIITAGVASTMTTAAAAMASASAAAKEKEKRTFSSSLKDEDDINDVAAMGGVNLVEESARIMAQNAEFIGTQIRSCKDENFLFTSPLQRRIRDIALKFGLEEPPPEVAAIVSHATQERLKDLVEKVGIIAEHRLEIVKGDPRHEVSQDVKGQLKFLEELDRLEKRRHEEQEREMLLRAAKSRSKLEDPEQLKLKQKAKEMQRAEQEEMRQREANNTALLAIGPRKKFKADPQSASGTGDGQQSGSSAGSGANNSNASSSSKPQMLRPRVKRVNLRDLVFLMEQEPETCRSVALYKAFLK